MAENKLLAKLLELAQLDVDAVGTYDAALARVTESMVREKLSEFRIDHLRHVQDLNARITELGGEPVKHTPDLKGLLLTGATTVSSLLGTEGALIAMVANEEVTTHSYQAALKVEWTPELRELIEKNAADERRHLEWMKHAVRERPWRHEEHAAQP